VRPISFASSHLSGAVSIYTAAKELSIAWAFDDAGSRKFFQQNCDLDYWPTAAARISDKRLTTGGAFILAGKRPASGKTVIERWDLTLTALPSYSADTITATRTILFDEVTPGRQVVRTLFAMNGVAGKILAQFDDSNDLYLLDCSTGLLSLSLTPGQVPYLADKLLQMRTGGKLATGAYCYIYQSDPGDSIVKALLLFDANADGLIDSTVEVPPGQWEAIVAPINWAERYDS
jgi:hypothetical protein